MLIDVNRFYSPREVIVKNGGILPLSISTVYAAIQCNDIPSKTMGKRILIPGSYLKRLLDESSDDHGDATS